VLCGGLDIVSCLLCLLLVLGHGLVGELRSPQVFERLVNRSLVARGVHELGAETKHCPANAAGVHEVLDALRDLLPLATGLDDLLQVARGDEQAHEAHVVREPGVGFDPTSRQPEELPRQRGVHGGLEDLGSKMLQLRGLGAPSIVSWAAFGQTVEKTSPSIVSCAPLAHAI